jgi:hypothetical protein
MSANSDLGTRPPDRGLPRWQKWLIGLVIVAAVIGVAWVVVAYVIQPEYAPTPREVVNPERHPHPAYDVWGRFVSAEQAAELMKTEDGRRLLSESHGAVPITPELLEEGREAFYEETFGNEVFATDVVGTLDGPLTASAVVQAIAALGGSHTTNLRVELAEDAVVGGKQFRKGQMIDTGLDVPKGGIAALGMKIHYQEGRLRVGVTCALCHAAVDPDTGLVIEGAPNSDLNIGLLMALAPNSAAYFLNTELEDLKQFVRDPNRTVETADGRREALPDPQALEDAVDYILVRWPPGQFDSTIDLKANPSKYPNSFTLGDHPYGWTGFAMAGPFRGLSVLNNNVHALNADGSMHADIVPDLYGIDKEVYLATILQNAANDRFRYDPASGRKPSEFFAEVNPRGEPGLSHTIALPTYPKASFISPSSIWISLPGRPAWRDVNAISAFQNTLRPPQAPILHDPEAAARGRAVFERARCADCHSGPFLTNNRVIPLPEIGTEPKRAPAKKDLEKLLVDPVAYGFDTPVPVPPDTPGVPVPLDRIDMEQMRLAWALGGRPGGYKVPALVGLYWSAPYLHDGGVAVGKDPAAELGMPGTLLRAVRPDPPNSLRALIDRELRQRVVAANQASEDLRPVSTQGIGHEFWVDAAAGFSPRDQDDLIHYLLTYEPPREGTP